MSLDNASTLSCLVFGLGEVFHRDTWDIPPMVPIILISHHMGIAFPQQQWALLQAKWSNRIQIIFGAICSLEALQGCHYKEPAVFPPSLVHQLEELAGDIEALGVLYS